ncbi:MAG: pyridoxamine 5'-phosphate oxidase family protein [Micrococcus sp.]|nr:pyridoxamine 5'-phosphate oxidase family protein [Micrococcus sp.]
MSLRELLRSVPSLTGSAPELDLESLPAHPVMLFRHWLAEAIQLGVPEPHAVSFATVDAEGIPDARTLILKDVDSRGWAVAGTASSVKGQQLRASPAAAIDVYWQPIMRAVRVRGTVEVASPEDCEADLAGRSEAARQAIAPGDWRLWWIRPARVEFFQASTDRQHVRVVYSTQDSVWRVDVFKGEEKLG